jgi:hypothetical protein
LAACSPPPWRERSRSIVCSHRSEERLPCWTPSGAAPFAIGSLRALIVDAVPVAAYAAIAGIGSFLLFWKRGLVFSGTDTFQMVASTIIANSLIAWFSIVLLSLPLAAGRPGLRWGPLGDREAAAIRRFVVRLVAIGGVSWIIAATLFLMQIGAGLPRLLMILSGAAICALSLDALARIRRRLSGFGGVCHKLAVASVFGLGATWVVALLTGGRPPFAPVLLTVLILAALPAADGMAALLLDRLRRRLVGKEKLRGVSMCLQPTLMTKRSLPSTNRSTARSARRSGSRRPDRPALSPKSSRKPPAGFWRSRRHCFWPRPSRSIFIRFCRNGHRGAGQHRRGRRDIACRLVRMASVRDRARGQIEPRRGWNA